MPRLALAGTGSHGAMLAAGARSLGWDLAAADADPMDADVVVVDTPAARRADDAISLLGRGVHVVLTPGCDIAAMTAVTEATAGSTSALAIGEPFPTAPAVQRWFTELNRLGELAEVDHLSGRAASAAEGAEADQVALDWPLLAVIVLSARLARWGDPVVGDSTDGAEVVRFASGATARLTIDRPATGRPPHWELQAASATGALRIEMLPRPQIERDGEPIALPSSPDPAETFGAAPLLRTFWADVTAGRRPVLDAGFGLSIERLRAQLSRAR